MLGEIVCYTRTQGVNETVEAPWIPDMEREPIRRISWRAQIESRTGQEAAVAGLFSRFNMIRHVQLPARLPL